MFPAQVYRIMIGCPGDVEDEVSIAQGVIRRWTGLHAEQSGVVLLPLHWSMDSYPAQGAHPQTLLNGSPGCGHDQTDREYYFENQQQ